MCPFCLASVGLIVVKATSAGGLTALVVKLSRKRNREKELTLNLSESSMGDYGRRIGLAEIASEPVGTRQ